MKDQFLSCSTINTQCMTRSGEITDYTHRRSRFENLCLLPVDVNQFFLTSPPPHWFLLPNDEAHCIKSTTIIWLVLSYQFNLEPRMASIRQYVKGTCALDQSSLT